jgi:hypothetical protein
VVPQGTDQLEVLATVGGLEQRARLDTGPHDVRLVGGARLELPHALQRRIGVGGELQRAVLGLLPGLAQVVAVEDGRAPVLALRTDEDAR